MTIYSVHIRDKGQKTDMALVRDGFSFGAMVFGFLWALYIGAWDLALFLLGVQMLSGALIGLLIVDASAQSVAQLGLAVIIGFGANELRRILLGWRGLLEVGVVTGTNPEDAERRYFDDHPDVTAYMLEAAR